MSKPYQIESRRAMQRFEASLRENQEPVQLLLPSVEIALAMKQGVGALIRQAGLLTVAVRARPGLKMLPKIGRRYIMSPPYNLDRKRFSMDVPLSQRYHEGSILESICFHLAVWAIRRGAKASSNSATLSKEAYGSWREQETIRMYRDNFSLEDLVGRRVLDFGCGNGEFTRFARGLGAAVVIGLDLHAQIQQISSENTDPCVLYQMGLPDSIPLPSHSVDIIVCLATMEHVMGWRSIVPEWRRVLKPDGIVRLWWSVWWHPYGHHCHTVIPLPWVHLFLDDAALNRVSARVHDSPYYKPRHWNFDEHGNRRPNPYIGITAFSDLNKLTTWRFEECARNAGFQIKRREPQPFTGNRLKTVKRTLSRLPRLCDFFSSAFIYELKV